MIRNNANSYHKNQLGGITDYAIKTFCSSFKTSFLTLEYYNSACEFGGFSTESEPNWTHTNLSERQ